MGNVCEVTEGRTLLAITQVSSASGLKKLYILIFSKYKYFHVKIASLANVQSCVTIGPINAKCFALYSPSVLPLRLSPLTEDTSMITVSSCGVKLQEVLSDLQKKRLKHWTYMGTFVAAKHDITITKAASCSWQLHTPLYDYIKTSNNRLPIMYS